MTNKDLAADYVMGVLSAEERAAVEGRTSRGRSGARGRN